MPATALATLLACVACAGPLVPPVASRLPHVRELHGERFVDDYFWLREKGRADVEAYLRAEDAYAKAVLAPLAPVEDVLFAEIVSHIAEDDESYPVKDGAFVYWRRLSKGKEHPVYLRRPVGAEGPAAAAAEEVILDQNLLAAGKEFMSLGALEVSDDAEWLLYSTDDTGFRQYTLHFKDLRSGAVAAESIPLVVMAAWAADNKTVFYVTEDEAKRPFRLYRHRVGTDPKTDVLVYEETDGRFELYLGRTHSGRFLIAHSESKLSSEERLIDAAKPDSAPVLIEARRDNIKYEAEERQGTLYLRVNDTGRNYRLVSAPVATPGKEHWKELRAQNDAVMLDDHTVFADFYVLAVLEGGLPHLELVRFDSGKAERISMPEPAYDVSMGDNREFGSRTFRYDYMSLTTPRTVFDYELDSGKSVLRRETPVPGGFDRQRYQVERLFATAKDGTRVPMSVVYRKDVARDGKAPLHLEAYGSYGFSFPVYFDPQRLTLLDRGVVYAIAHIRGGGELGKAWHEQGRLAHKMNTFTDFIACAEHLIAQGYTSSARLTIEGGSAGGLLMGAVTNLRPDLFKGVLNEVPFVDVVNTMNDPTLPLTITEYEEWGNPNIAAEYAWIRAYSPYDNLEAKAYPSIFVRTSYNDSQVMYWEPAKYVARLRALKTDHNPLLFAVHMEPAGHGGKSGRYERYRETAQAQTFLLWQQGVVAMPEP